VIKTLKKDKYKMATIVQPTIISPSSQSSAEPRF
jgi:hypothetical protein